MTYRIFVSHTEVDTPIAKAVAKVVNDSFQGEIQVYLAVAEVVGGIEWKNELRKRLAECDALISIITPESIRKPWLYIEWSPFWMNDKIYYILLTDNIAVRDLIQPMRDRQAIDIVDRDQVLRWAKALHNDADTNIPIPWGFADKFVKAMYESLNVKSINQYGAYRADLSGLPTDDLEKRKIAKYFYENDEIRVFENIIGEIRKDVVKLDIIREVINDGKYEHLKELEIAQAISQKINGSNYVSSLVRELIDLGDVDSKSFRLILDDLCKRSQPETGGVLLYLNELNLENTDLFEYVLGKIKSRAQLRIVAEKFIEEGNVSSDVFRNILSKMTRNRAELRKLGYELMEHGHHKTETFDWLCDDLFKNSLPQAKYLLEELAKIDLNAVCKVLSRQDLTNPAIKNMTNTYGC